MDNQKQYWREVEQTLFIWFMDESTMSEYPKWMLEAVPMPFMPVICED